MLNQEVFLTVYDQAGQVCLNTKGVVEELATKLLVKIDETYGIKLSINYKTKDILSFTFHNKAGEVIDRLFNKTALTSFSKTGYLEFSFEEN